METELETWRDKLLFAGERLFQAAIFMITASVLKSAIIAVRGASEAAWLAAVVGIATVPVAIGTVTFFFFAVLEADRGFSIVFDHLEDRRSRKIENERAGQSKSRGKVVDHPADSHSAKIDDEAMDL